MKRVLILVLSTDKEFYGNLYETSVRTWDLRDVEGVETIFYFARDSAVPRNSKTLLVDSDDDFFSMGKKTLAAFDFALKNREFDFIFRANASLFINKPGLLRYAQNWPTENLALGVVADCGRFESQQFSFLWGPSYMLSRDVVQKVVDQAGHWNHKMMEDNAISCVLHALDIPLDNRGSMASIALKGGGYEFVYYENGAGGGAFLADLAELPQRLPGQFAVRVKNDLDRSVDIQLMKELSAAFN